MWKRVSLVWAVVKGDARLLWFALQHPQSPPWLKWGTAGIVLYLLSPVDLVPDFIPVAGLLDDLVLYRVPADQLALARNLGLAPGAPRVTPEGLRVDLLPQGLR